MKYNQPLGQEVFQQFPEHEWNYADLYGNETEIRIATIYEYTRCCGWIADKYVSWLDSPIEVENSDAIGGLCARSDGLSTARKLLASIQESDPNDPQKKKDVKDLFLALTLCMPECLKGHSLTTQMLHLVEFPSPFMKIRKSSWFSTINQFDNAICEFINRGELFNKPKKNWPVSKILKVHQDFEEVTIAINWNKRDKAILDDLKRWIKESRPIPEPTSRNREAGYPLKSLAAQRLNQAFKQSQVSPINIASCLKEIFGNDIKSKAVQELVPYYEEQGAVSRAAKDCLKYIQDRIAFYWQYGGSTDTKRIAIPWGPDTPLKEMDS